MQARTDAQTQTQGSSGVSLQSLPPELIAEASRRLPWLGLVFALTYLLNRVGLRIVGSLTGTLHGSWVQDELAFAAVVLGVALYFAARSSRLSPAQKLQMARAFQILGAFCIALTEFWFGFPIELVSTALLIPVECAWIIAFPLFVPDSPGQVLKTALLAASMGPIALGVSAGVHGYAIEGPWLVGTYFLSTNFVSALFAYLLSNIVYRIGARLRMAREIGSYEMLDRIGEGGMGQVWRGRHRLLARSAAIKLIRTELLGANLDDRADTIRRFEREARETAALGSIHTIDIYDYGVTEEGDFYYVMELLNGISLERYVRQFGPMPPARVVYLLKQACHSLGEAHSRGLIHRDIKPANIFMCRLGPDDDFVKVLDFGLVRHFGDCVPGSLPTIEEITAGTPAFMPPEMILSDPHVDGRADVYALGCVAYFLLTGRTVFKGESAIAIMLAHIKDAPVAPSAGSLFDVPDRLDRLILDCLAKDKALRPGSVGEVAQRLVECASADAWSAEAARLWWQGHQPAVVTPCSGDAGASRRCRPCLDREPRPLADVPA